MRTFLEISVSAVGPDHRPRQMFMMRRILDMPFFARKGDMIAVLGDDREVIGSYYDMDSEEGPMSTYPAVVTLSPYVKPEDETWEETKECFTREGFTFLDLGYLDAPECFYPKENEP